MLISVNNKKSKIIYGGKDNLVDFEIKKELKEFLSVYSDGYERSNNYNDKSIVCNNCGFRIATKENLFKCTSCGKKELEITRKWDGKKSFINYELQFDTGFLPLVYSFLIDNGYQISIEDNRSNKFTFSKKVVKDILVWKMRKFMVKDIKKFLTNKVHDLQYLRGIYKAATNAGKNSFIASCYLTLNQPLLLIVHSKELFTQAVEFFTLCGIEVSEYGLGKENTGHFTIAMIKTLLNRSINMSIKEYLQTIPILVIDESHKASSNEYIKLIKQIDAYSVLFVSGTPLDSDSDEDVMKIIGQSGPIVAERTNKFLISKKYSQKVNVEIFEYSDILPMKETHIQEQSRLQNSIYRLEKIRQACVRHKDKKILIVVKHLKHGKIIQDYLMNLDLIVEFVHGKDKTRTQKLNRFKTDKVNILISTMIVKEGINNKLIEVGINAWGGKSVISTKQVIGRIVRQNDISDECIWIDFTDKGKNLSKHYDLRMQLYKDEGFDISFILDK